MSTRNQDNIEEIYAFSDIRDGDCVRAWKWVPYGDRQEQVIVEGIAHADGKGNLTIDGTPVLQTAADGNLGFLSATRDSSESLPTHFGSIIALHEYGLNSYTPPRLVALTLDRKWIGVYTGKEIEVGNIVSWSSVTLSVDSERNWL